MSSDSSGRQKEIPFSWIFLSRVATKGTLDGLFRVLGAKRVLPDLFYIRPLIMGSNFLDVREAFSRINSWEEWVESWQRVGAKRELFGDLALEGGRSITARENYLYATAAYHMAQLLLYDEIEKKREIYNHCASCFRRCAPLLTPPALEVEIPFESISLPGYLRIPEGSSPVPLLILICGADGDKEEMQFFSEGLVRRGVATLAFDGPGIGETWDRMPMRSDYGMVGSVLFDFLVKDERIDPKRIGVYGVSHGGNLALQVAAHEPRTSAVIALSAPYDLASYGEYVLPVIQDLYMFLLKTDSEEEYRQWAESFSVKGLIEKIQAPLLVIGGGEDLFIPGEHTKRIFNEAKCKKKLVYFEEANHLCAEYAYELAPKVEEWLLDIGFLGG